MDDPDQTLFLRALRRIAHLVLHHPRWFVWPQIALAVLCVAYTLNSLKFSTSRNDLVSDRLHYHHIFLEFRKEFPAGDDIVAVVESESAEKNRQFVERLGARIEAETNLFTDVFFRGDMTMLGRKALLFLNEPTLLELQKSLRDYRPFLSRFTTTTNLNSLFQLINRTFRSAARGTNADTESLVGALPALERIVAQARDSLLRPGTPPSPGVNALFGGGPEAERQIYLTYDQGRVYLLSLRPRDAENPGHAIARLRELLRETRLEVPGINADITGGSVLELDEMNQSQSDTTIATILSLVLVALIFIYGYNQIKRPLKAMFCLLIGLCYSMGFTTLAVGRLNILTITFAPMLVGMAIDFGVHLITRYEEELRRGVARQLALLKAMVNTGQGIYTGAFTTAGAFLAMSFTDFSGVREMGIITGGGLLVCLIPMMTLLPAMLLKEHLRQSDIHHDGLRQTHNHRNHGGTFRERFEAFVLGRPGLISVVGLVVSIAALSQFGRVYFDYDLRNMQSPGLPAVIFEKKLMSSTPRSVLFGAVVAPNAEEAVKLQARLTNLTTVAEVDSIAPMLVGDASRRLQLIGEVKDELASLHIPEPSGVRPNLRELSQTLTFVQAYLGKAAETVAAETTETNLLRQLRSLRAVIGDLRKQMANGDPDGNATKLGAFEHAFFEDVRNTFETLKHQDNSAPLRIEDLPPTIRNRFVGVHGRFLLQVYPNIDVWIRTNQQAFVGELRTVVPDATGEPVQLLEYTTLLRKSYEQAAWFSLGAMVVLVYLQFRSIKSVLLAHVPVVLAGIWLVGLMGLFGIPFNPANIMTLPLVVGIGVTFGVHILTRFAEEKHPAILAKSTGKAVLVSGLTTVCGFGSLIVAKHQGIVSLGFVMAVGVVAAIVASLISLPALLVLMKPANPSQKRTQRH